MKSQLYNRKPTSANGRTSPPNVRKSPNVSPTPLILNMPEEESDTKITVENVPLDGKNLFVAITARCDPHPEPYPKAMPRLLHAKLGEQKLMSWIGAESFASYFSFSNDKPKTENAVLELTVEGTTPVTIDRVTAHHAADVMYREFEHGIVPANPGGEPHGFDLEKLFSGKKYRRLRAMAIPADGTSSGAVFGNSILPNGYMS